MWLLYVSLFYVVIAVWGRHGLGLLLVSLWFFTPQALDLVGGIFHKLAEGVSGGSREDGGGSDEESESDDE